MYVVSCDVHFHYSDDAFMCTACTRKDNHVTFLILYIDNGECTVEEDYKVIRLMAAHNITLAERQALK